MRDMKNVILNYLKATNSDIAITEKEFQSIQAQYNIYSKLALCTPLKIWREDNILCIEWDITDSIGNYEWYHYTNDTWY